MVSDVITWTSQTSSSRSVSPVCQFLQDILDTLFSILDDNTDKYGLLVFQSLVRIPFQAGSP